MWVNSNLYFLLIICCLYKQNKVCYIIICDCEIKLKYLIIVFVKERDKAYKKGEDIVPGEMMLLRDINNNITMSHPSYSGVYQDETEKLRALPRDEYYIWFEPKNVRN